MELVSLNSENFHFLAFSEPREPPGSVADLKKLPIWTLIKYRSFLSQWEFFEHRCQKI
jgi:hypothetical protein